MNVKPCDFDGVCGVLEMFGFFIGKKFYPREVGMSGRNGTSSHQKYVIPFEYRQLDLGDQMLVQVCKRHIHGLKFHAREEEHAHERDRLEQDVMDLYESAKSEIRDVIAYRGGQPERELLTKLNIPSLDLNALGYSKLDFLKKSGYQLSDGCDHHIGGSSNIKCAYAVCSIFQKWITDVQERRISLKKVE